MDVDAYSVGAGQHVLVTWPHGAEQSASFTTFVTTLRVKVGDTGSVQVASVNRDFLSSLVKSSFDLALIGATDEATWVTSEATLQEVLRVLKVSGRLCLRDICTDSQEDAGLRRTRDKLLSLLKLNGFIDVDLKVQSPLSGSHLQHAKSELHMGDVDVTLCFIVARKPDYEVGASAPLKLSLGLAGQGKSSTPATNKAVWSLSASDVLDDEVELLDSDTVLDEDDLRKPDPSTLKASCDKATKRRACKNCTCGLAEELSSQTQRQAPVDTQSSTSACGSCYLGDAFRCAGCPYRGTPAFKPGEKVQLSTE